MRLATFVHGGQERFGFVLHHPLDGEDWVFDPARAEARLYGYAARPTSPYYSARPRFAPADGWPRSLTAFLQLGDEGMDRLRRLQDFLCRFLEQTDSWLLGDAGWPVAAVKLRAPIPRPRLLWGLVQNSPAFIRHAPGRTHMNLYPQGHQRPQGSVLGPGDPVIIPVEAAGRFGWNPEPGIIIGRHGKHIPIDETMRYVAGFTVVTDAVPFFYWRQVHEQPDPLADWFEDAMGSWGDKKSDTMCPVGPYLVTPDEVGNPYDLLIFSRQNGLPRDRSYTGAMLLGFERVVSWLSSFMTLYPGDIIHLASMGVDGLPTLDDSADPPLFTDRLGSEATIESEIERVGVLRNPLIVAGTHDPRPVDDPTRAIHPAPAARDLIAAGEDSVTAQAWQVEAVRHFWIVSGNYREAEAQEGLRPRPYPRFLNAPARALAASGHSIILPPRARDLTLGCELAFVVGRLAHRVTVEAAPEYILGDVVLAVVLDGSFADGVIAPATPQERAMPAVYGRWGDGYNVISAPPVALATTTGRECVIAVEGVGEAYGSTDEYLLGAAEMLAFITQQITLFPGDVVTLGRLAERLTIPADMPLPQGASGYAGITGLGRVTFTFDDRRAVGG